MRTTRKLFIFGIVFISLQAFSTKEVPRVVQVMETHPNVVSGNLTYEAIQKDVSTKGSFIAPTFSGNTALVAKKNPEFIKYEEFLKENKIWIENLRDKNRDHFKEFQERYKDNPNWYKSGGVTDGGGNIVNGQLYDYWVMTGTKNIRIDHLVNWNEDLQSMLLNMKSLSPAVSEIKYKGWVEEIIQVASKQKWILDAKPINNVDCWNLSPNVTELQSVVGCNSVSEVRIYAPIFFGMINEKPLHLETFQSSFILHELLLSWARSKFGTQMTKYDIEFGVQRLNYAIRRNENIIETLREHFPNAKILNQNEILVLQRMNQDILYTGLRICNAEQVTNLDQYNLASSNPLFRKYLHLPLRQLLAALRSIGTPDEALNRNAFCYRNKFYKVTSFERLSRGCREIIEQTVQKIAEEFVPKVRTELEMDTAYADKAHLAGLACYDLERMGDTDTKAEVYLQALGYFDLMIGKYSLNSQAPFLFAPSGW